LKNSKKVITPVNKKMSTKIKFVLNTVVLFVAAISTIAQTQLVKDINTNPASIPTGTPVTSGNLVYFPNKDSKGTELWRTDGTSDGTFRVKDLSPGFDSGLNGFMCDLNGKLLFTGQQGDNAIKLFVTSGTEQSTQLLADLHKFQYQMGACRLNSKVIFYSAPDPYTIQLWKTDGTEGGTIPFHKIETGQDYIIFVTDLVSTSQYVFFSIFKSTPTGLNSEIWSTDGTEAGTQLLGTSLFIYNVTAIGDKVAFLKSPDGIRLSQLWMSDGSTAGTSLVFDSQPYFHYPSQLNAPIAYNNNIIFTCNGYLFISDGSPSGTIKLTDGSFDTYFILQSATVNNIFYGVVENLTSSILIKSDGTPGGTSFCFELGPLNSDYGYKNLNYIPVTNQQLIIPLYNADTGWEPGISDGTLAGTAPLKDIFPGTTSSHAMQFALLGNQYVFVATDNVHGAELWITDGTSGSTHLIKDTRPGTEDAWLAYATNGKPTIAGKDLIFNACSTYSPHLFNNFIDIWKSDGTGVGTLSLTDQSNENILGISSQHIISMEQTYKLSSYSIPSGGLSFVEDLNGKIDGWGVVEKMFYPIGTDKIVFGFSTNGKELDYGTEYWVTDGTQDGTHVLKDIYPGNISGISAKGIKLNESTLIFDANDNVNGYELWSTDGTSAGTNLVKDINPGTTESLPDEFTTLKNLVLFTADDGVHGRELWKSDGTAAGTTLVKDLIAGATGSQLVALTSSGNAAYYAKFSEGSGWELWKTDGTADGTVYVKTINTINDFTQIPKNAIDINGKLFFTAADDTHGNELWISDGTANGTKVIDLNVGALGSNPSLLTKVGSGLYFKAMNQLWRYADGTFLEKVSDDEPITLNYLDGFVYCMLASDLYGIELFKTPVTKTSTALTFILADQNFADGHFTLQASTNSLLPISFSSSSDKISIEGTNVTMLKPGSATITASVPGDDIFDSAQTSQTICIIPSKPIAQITVNNPAGPTLSSNSASGNEWFFNDSKIQDATAQTLTATRTGNYTVQVNIDNCISDMSAPLSVVVLAVKEKSRVAVYPNPCHDKITIHSDQLIESIFLSDISGRKILEWQPETEIQTGDISSVPNGVYFLQIKSSQGVIYKKVVKE
jgi:ELWxxDGT repeat protein